MSRYQQLTTELRATPRRWLVTGAAGFIGSALVEQLLGLGQKVVGLDNFATGRRSNLDEVARVVGDAAARFDFIEGDICDLATCQRATAGVDFVLHQAALGSVPRSLADPIATHTANVDGFLTMLVAARDAKVQRMVYASSSSVYGDHPVLPKVEDNIGKPLSPYAATKRVDEIYARVFQDCYGLELIGLRYFNVFGRRQDPAGQYAAVIPRWIDSLRRGERCKIFGDGSQSRDFCYVDNAVQANLLAATAADPAVTGTIYNVGCRGRTSLLELHDLLRDRVARTVPAARDLRPEHTAPRPGDVAHSQANLDKITAALAYQPSHEIDAGLDHTVAWFMDHPQG